MILDSSMKLEAVLAGAVSTSQPEAHVGYVDFTIEGKQTRPAPFRVSLNSTTDVTILASPTGNAVRKTESISIYNKDTASVTVTVKTDDGSTEKIVVKQTLATLETLCWDLGVGWYVI